MSLIEPHREMPSFKIVITSSSRHPLQRQHPQDKGISHNPWQRRHYNLSQWGDILSNRNSKTWNPRLITTYFHASHGPISGPENARQSRLSSPAELLRKIRFGNTTGDYTPQYFFTPDWNGLERSTTGMVWNDPRLKPFGMTDDWIVRR